MGHIYPYFKKLRNMLLYLYLQTCLKTLMYVDIVFMWKYTRICPHPHCGFDFEAANQLTANCSHDQVFRSWTFVQSLNSLFSRSLLEQ